MDKNMFYKHFNICLSQKSLGNGYAKPGTYTRKYQKRLPWHFLVEFTANFLKMNKYFKKPLSNNWVTRVMFSYICNVYIIKIMLNMEKINGADEWWGRH